MLTIWELIFRLGLATVLGGLIGFERERLRWAAGLRTHMLVCVSSALIMIVSIYGFADVLSTRNIALDPSRVAAQVVSGIGFLGAGAILLRGEIVRGLTTAASLWSVAAVGLAVGGGLYVAAISATTIILIILAGIKPFKRHFRLTRQRLTLRLLAEHGSVSFFSFSTFLKTVGMRVRTTQIKQFIVQPAEIAQTDEVTVVFSRVSAREVADMMKALNELSYVREVREIREIR